MTNFEMILDGALIISGNLTVGSCSGCTAARSVGESSAGLLSKLSQVPILRWQARHEDAAAGTEVFADHLMPNAEVFQALYGLGLDGDGIAPLDVATVALAAAQALEEENRSLPAETEAQRLRIESLGARLLAIEAALDIESPPAPQASERIYMPSTGR